MLPKFQTYKLRIWAIMLKNFSISRPNTALLELGASWYPPHGEEDTDGRAYQSGGVAGTEGVFGQFRGALSAPGGPNCPGALYDRVAHGTAQQELRHDRSG